MKRFVGRWVWILCWKTPLVHYRLAQDIGTIVWCWGYRDFKQINKGGG